MSYSTTISNNNITISVDSTDHVVSLSRTGGQGAKGDSISNAYINADSDFIVEISNSVGDIVETINAGNIFADADLDEINDVSITNIQDGDYIAYDAATQTYVNHQLTTAKVTDIDNTNKTDGALLVYNGQNQKYTATATLDNVNTSIIGGTF